jgi:hypothetical protein
MTKENGKIPKLIVYQFRNPESRTPDTARGLKPGLARLLASVMRLAGRKREREVNGPDRRNWKHSLSGSYWRQSLSAKAYHYARSDDDKSMRFRAIGVIVCPKVQIGG